METAQKRRVTGLLAEETLSEVLAALGAAGVLVMPMKGVLFQKWLYERASERPLTDVDVLVDARSFDAAAEALVRAGHRAAHAPPSGGQRTFTSRLGFDVDLHSELFPPGRFRFEARDVLARATHGAELFGAPALIMDPVDAYAHVIGKVAIDHTDARVPVPLMDLLLLGERMGLVATEVAARLREGGLDRAARYVLPMVVAHGNAQAAAPKGIALASDVLRVLGPDPVGTAAASVARTAVAVFPPRSRSAAPFAHLLGPSLLALPGTALRATRSYRKS